MGSEAPPTHSARTRAWNRRRTRRLQRGQTDFNPRQSPLTILSTREHSAVISTMAHERHAADALESTLEDRLKPWFSCFCHGWVDWGHVDFYRDDGTSYKRHGVIVELRVNADKILRDEGGIVDLPKLREAVDLAQIVLAAQPSAIRSLLWKFVSCRLIPRKETSSQRTRTEELLDAVSRGVPADVRLRFDLDCVCMSVQENFFTADTMRAFDSKLSTDESFLALRQELLDRIVGDSGKRLQLNHKTTRAVLELGSSYIGAPCGARFARLLDALEAFPQVVSSHLHAREVPAPEDTIATRHTLFEFEEIGLMFDQEILNTQVVKSATKLSAATLPIDWAYINLDLRMLECDEDQLRVFARAVAEQSTSLSVSTMSVATPEIKELFAHCLDSNMEDCRELIRMTLRAITAIGDRLTDLDIGGLLRLCTQDHNREAVWQGLFEDILRPRSSLEKLFSDFRYSEPIELRDDDATCIERFALQWHGSHPEERLCIKRLTLHLKQSDDRALCSLISAFDDVEVISLLHPQHERPLSRAVLEAALAFPSLRKLTVNNIVVPSMDMFNPSIADDSRPLTPVLEKLELKDIVLEDVSSLERFIASLDPSQSSSPLATTLRRFHVTQRECDARDPVVFFDFSTVIALDDMLKSNRVLTEITVTEVGNMSIDGQWIELLKHDGRCLPARRKPKSSSLSKAQCAAFLSVVYSDAWSAPCPLDGTLVGCILDFAAPAVDRTIQKIQIPVSNMRPRPEPLHPMFLEDFDY